MSKQIDERVVSMQFDNRHFETNVRTSLSTLDKLKEKLNFTGATKGLENVSAAAKNVNMSGLGSAVETVRTKFSALEVMGITALANITNSAVNAGKRIASSLTIEPVTTGFNEYELKMGSIQTIMASTGESLETVNGYLNELNEYSDKTIYSFADMTSNIGKFTNAGVSLEESVAAIKGVANAAALSGANAAQASHAMYNFGQALSAGYVKLTDWKSIEISTIATKQFKEQLIETAVEMGTLVKQGDKYISTTKDANGSVSDAFTATRMFNESLSSQWMTTEVLTKVLNNYADETTEIGKKATAAAQDVKTFSMMMDTLKESAQSGWAQTWETIVGDFSEAKNLFTMLSKVFGGIIDATSNIRNKIVGGALKSNFEKLTDKIQEAGLSTEDFQNNIKELAKEHNVDLDSMIEKEGSFEKALKKAFNDKILDKSIIGKALKGLLGDFDKATKSTENMAEQMEKYGKIVDKVIQGDFGNGKVRIEKLTEAGYDYATIQNLVNEKLGVSVRHTSKLTEEQLKNADSLSKLSDKQLENKGYTKEQIEAIRELAEQADKAGTSISELIDGMGKTSGRDLLIDSFKNIGTAIGKVFEGIKKAWKEIYSIDTNNVSDGIYGFLESFHAFTEGLNDIDSTVDKITRIAKGVFAFTQLFTSFNFKLATTGLKILRGVLGLTNFDILEMVASMGDAIVKVRDLIFNNRILEISLETIGDGVVKAFTAVAQWIRKFFELKGVQKTLENLRGVIETITNAITGLFDGTMSIGEAFGSIGEKIMNTYPFIKKMVDTIKEWIDILKEVPGIKKALSFITDFFEGTGDTFAKAKEIGKNVIEGIKQGLKDGTMTLGQAIINLGKMLIDMFCSVLGIHSPSKEFAEAGGNIIDGLVQGLQNGASKLWETITGIASKLVEFFKNIDWGAIFAAGMGVGILYLGKRAIDVAESFNGIGKMFGSIGSYFNKMGDAKKITARSEAILNIAKAIGILAASIVVLAMLDTNQLIKAGIALAILTGVLVGLSFAAKKMEGVSFNNVGKQAIALIGISNSLILVAVAMKILSTIDTYELPSVIAGFVLAIVGLAGAMAVMGKFVKGKTAVNATKIGGMIFAMALAITMMAVAMKLLSGMDPSSIYKGLGVILAIEALFAAFVLVSKFAGKNAAKAGIMLLAMSAAFMIMIGVIKVASMLRADEVLKGMGAIIAISLVFAALIAVSKLAGRNGARAGAMLLLMSGAFLIMTSVIKRIAGLEDADIERGLDVIKGVGLIFTALIVVSRLAGENGAKAGVMLLTMSVALLVLTGVLHILSKMDSEGLGKALGIVAFLELMFAGLIAVTYLAKDCEKTLTRMIIIIALLVVAVVGLSFIDPERLKTAALSIAAVLTSFGIMMAATGQLSKITNAKQILGPLSAMLLIVAGLAAIMWAMSALDVQASIQTAGALSILLLAMSASLAIISKFGKGSYSSIVALALIGAVVAEIAIILGLMSKFDMNASMENVKALSALLLVMSGVLVVLSLLGPMASNSLVGIGALVLIGLVIAELGLILGLMKHFDVQPSMEVVKPLSMLLLSLSGVLVILGGVGLLGPAAFIGIGALATLIAALGIILTALGGLSKIDGFNELIRDGGETLALIGYALGKFVGSIVGGLAEGVTASLPTIGKSLADFMTNVTPFIEGVKNIDETAVKGIAALSGAILILTAADLISGVTSFLSGGSSFAQLGTQLSMFMLNAMPFIMGASLLNADMMEGVKSLAQTVLILTAADVLNGLTSWIKGDSTQALTTFGDQLPTLATSIKDFATNLGTFDESKVESVKCAANAIKAIADAAVTIPNEGGLWGSIFGENGIGAFGDQLPTVGKKLNEFATNLGSFGKTQVETIKCAANAIKAIAEAAKDIPNEGGIWASIFGDNSIATFGGQLPDLGTNLSGFATNLGTFTEEQVTTIKCAANAIKAMAEAASTIDGQTEWAKALFGDNSLAGFGTQIESVGTSLNGFVTNLGTFTAAQVATVNSAVAAIKAFASLANADLKAAKKQLPGFGDKLPGLATDIASFVTNMPTGETVSAATKNLKTLVKAINGITETNADNISSFSKSLKSLGTAGVDAFVKAFTSSATLDKVKKAGKGLMTQIINGVKAKSNDVKKAFTTAANKASDAVDDEYDSFYDAGSDLVDGFAAGISENDYKAAAKAKAMAEAAVKAAKEALDINSPSKVFRAIGSSVPEGFILGIGMYRTAILRASDSMANMSIDSVKDSLSRIADIVTGDIDVQPTIRPVLDMSSVSAGASAINGMFNANPSIGLMTNVGAINKMMYRRQNGTNDEILGAIKDVNKTLGDKSTNTYNFGSITYGDESAISEAVNSLVRAIVRERRT